MIKHDSIINKKDDFRENLYLILLMLNLKKNVWKKADNFVKQDVQICLI